MATGKPGRVGNEQAQPGAGCALIAGVSCLLIACRWLRAGVLRAEGIENGGVEFVCAPGFSDEAVILLRGEVKGVNLLPV